MERKKALDSGEDLEAKLAAQQHVASSTSTSEQAWTAETREMMLQKIRKWNPHLTPRMNKKLKYKLDSYMQAPKK